MNAAPIPAELATAMKVLDRPFEEAETKLLAIGQDLLRSNDLLSSLISTFAALPVSLENAELLRAAKHIADIAGDIADVGRVLSEEQQALRRLVGFAHNVGKHIERLRATVGTISVLAVNARIAAAQINAQGEDFTVFTGEIARLALTAVESIEAFARENNGLIAFLEAAADNQKAFAKKHAPTLETIRQKLSVSVSALDRRRAKAVADAAIIQRRSDQIRAGVNGVVMGLQVGDSARQRIEHAAQALLLLAAESTSLPAGERRALTATVAGLQEAQVRETAVDFEAEIGRAVTSLIELGREAQSIQEMGVELYGGARAEAGSFLSALGEELGEAITLVRVCVASRSEVDHIAAEAGNALRQLLLQVGNMRRVEGDMRLVGLNTMLKCGRLGSEGRMLSVIANELRGYANQTVEDSHNVAEALRALETAAAKLGDAEGEATLSRFTDLETRTGQAAEQFRMAGDALGGALSMLRRDGTEVGHLLRRTVDGIDFRSRTAKRLSTMVEALQRLSSTRQPNDTDPPVGYTPFLQALKRNYTMAREREIHRQFCFGLGIADVEEAPPPAAAQDADALLEDVLF